MWKKAIRVGSLVVLVAAMLVTVAFGTAGGRAVVDWAAGRGNDSTESESASLGEAFVAMGSEGVVTTMREIWLLAEEGNLQALMVFPEALTEEVGERTLFEIEPPDPAESQKLAARGVPRGLVEMAGRYRDGEGVKQDLEEARRLFLEAAEKGHPGGHIGLAKLYFEGQGVPQSYEKAREYFRVAAEGHQRYAQRRLAEMYVEGLGVEASDEEAVRWYRLAAKKGDQASCYALADLLLEERAAGLDADELVECLEKEAKWGTAEAQWKLGLLYARGAELAASNVPAGFSETDWRKTCWQQSLRWLRLAASDGHEEAARRVAEHYVEVEARLGRLRRLSAWPGRLPDLEDAEVLNNLAVWLEKNNGGRENIEWALGKARALGDPRAELNLGLLDLDHEAGDQRLVDGIRHLRNSAAKGLPEAMNELGVCYATGWGVERDSAEAMAWFRKAAAAGNVDAQFNLGVIYLRGKDVEQDYRQANEWLARAASAGDPITAAMRDRVGELLAAESSNQAAL